MNFAQTDAAFPTDCYSCAAHHDRKLCSAAGATRGSPAAGHTGTCCLPTDSSAQCTASEQVTCSSTFEESQELFYAFCPSARSASQCGAAELVAGAERQELAVDSLERAKGHACAYRVSAGALGPNERAQVILKFKLMEGVEAFLFKAEEVDSRIRVAR